MVNIPPLSVIEVLICAAWPVANGSWVIYSFHKDDNVSGVYRN